MRGGILLAFNKSNDRLSTEAGQLHYYDLPDNKNRVALPTLELLLHLNSLDTSPWSEYKGGNLKPRGLSALLNRYDIKPDQRRDPPNTPQFRGYLVADFKDAWSRYLPDTKISVTPVTTVTADTEIGSWTEDFVTGVTGVTDAEGDGYKPDNNDKYDGAYTEQGEILGSQGLESFNH